MSTANLVPCPDCGHQVSRNAPACPHCGSPLQARTIEQTGKRYKAVQLAGWLTCSLGLACASLVVLMGPDPSEGAPLGRILAFMLAAGVVSIGILLVVAAKTVAWWYHG